MVWLGTIRDLLGLPKACKKEESRAYWITHMLVDANALKNQRTKQESARILLDEAEQMRETNPDEFAGLISPDPGFWELQKKVLQDIACA
ncbi:MAG: hypothetical protein PHR28_04925 [candidate division Zixibacteria bacterium]|jgi:hypothetical protein|nr:hypothetical protein [candidate division Zixibacteria bacterium]